MNEFNYNNLYVINNIKFTLLLYIQFYGGFIQFLIYSKVKIL